MHDYCGKSKPGGRKKSIEGGTVVYRVRTVAKAEMRPSSGVSLLERGSPVGTWQWVNLQPTTL